VFKIAFYFDIISNSQVPQFDCLWLGFVKCSPKTLTVDASQHSLYSFAICIEIQASVLDVLNVHIYSISVFCLNVKGLVYANNVSDDCLFYL